MRSTCWATLDIRKVGQRTHHHPKDHPPLFSGSLLPHPQLPGGLTRCKLRQSTRAVRCWRFTSVPLSTSWTRSKGSWGGQSHTT